MLAAVALALPRENAPPYFATQETMPPKTIKKLSQRKIKPVEESAGSGLAPSSASTGSAVKKKAMSQAEAKTNRWRKVFIAPPCPGNCPVRMGVRQERLRQFHWPDRRWTVPSGLAPP